jgi:hypothetical protein
VEFLVKYFEYRLRTVSGDIDPSEEEEYFKYFNNIEE